MRRIQSSEFRRRYLFNNISKIGFILGGFYAMQNSRKRLKGRTENGLKWRRPDRKLIKYDFTKDFEANSIFKYLRIRD